MIINTPYFGEIQVDEKGVIRFEEGMLGFEEIKEYVLIKDEEIFVEWLQSTDGEVSFAVADPYLITQKYEFEIPEETLSKLEIESPEQVAVRCVVVIPEDIKKIRSNLQAPIIMNVDKGKAAQIILGDNYPMKYEFYDDQGGI